jgi:hypothetical protein
MEVRGDGVTRSERRAMGGKIPVEDEIQRPALHVAYTDETRYNTGRYRGLAMLSLRAEHAAELSAAVRGLLDASGVAECKWEKVRSARARFAAEKLLDLAMAEAQAGRLRLDALTWDTDAASRAGTGVPHIANLRRMYLHLLGTILPARWPAAERWRVFPDEQGALDGERLAARLPHVAEIIPCHSDAEPLIQLADLFAGLAAYSRSGYDTYERWLCLPPAERASDAPHPALPLSASDHVRCALLDDFFTRCKLLGLGVSLRTHRSLRTYGMTPPLAFHCYAG